MKAWVIKTLFCHWKYGFKLPLCCISFILSQTYWLQGEVWAGWNQYPILNNLVWGAVVIVSWRRDWFWLLNNFVRGPVLGTVLFLYTQGIGDTIRSQYSIILLKVQTKADLLNTQSSHCCWRHKRCMTKGKHPRLIHFICNKNTGNKPVSLCFVTGNS